MQRTHTAARRQHQVDQLGRKALNNSETHGPRFKPGDNLWSHSSVTPKGLSPKLSFPWKDPYTIVQCLNDVIYGIKNTANEKETIVHFCCLKPFIQRPENLQLPRQEPSLPRESTCTSAPELHSVTHKHCNWYQILFNLIAPSSWTNYLTKPVFCTFCSQNPHPRIFCCCMSKRGILGPQENHPL